MLFHRMSVVRFAIKALDMFMAHFNNTWQTYFLLILHTTMADARQCLYKTILRCEDNEFLCSVSNVRHFCKLLINQKPR